jgi:DNA repair protein RadD
MSFVLRPYQKQAIDSAITFFKLPSNINGVTILPTGSGKSIVIAGIIKELQDRVLILQPSKEILTQNFNKYRAYGFYASVYSASLGRKEISRTVFGTIGSVRNKSKLFKDFRYIIIDECHLVNAYDGMYAKFLAELPQCKVLGLTATPYRLSSDSFGGSILKFITRTSPKIFNSVIYYVQNKELFDAGYLAPIKYYKIGNFDRAQLKLNSTGADYDDRSVRKYYDEIDLGSTMAKSVIRLMEIRKNVLVFVRYIKEAQALCNRVPGSEIVTGDMEPAQRDNILKRFQSGQLKCLINIGVVAIGFDKPDLETVVIGRETMSLALYYQWIGRAIRIHPDKTEAWVVDLCGNIDVFGRVEDLHITADKPGKWYIQSRGKQLTNVYFGEVFKHRGNKNASTLSIPGI